VPVKIEVLAPNQRPIQVTDDLTKLLARHVPEGEGRALAPLSAARMAVVVEAIKATGAQSKKDMGKVIGALKQRPEASLIDFGAVSKIVQAKLPQALPEAKKPEPKVESGKEAPPSETQSPNPPAGN
jgi:hypothetical protein